MDKRTVRRIVATALAVILAEQVFFTDLWFWTACTVRGYIYGRTEK